MPGTPPVGRPWIARTIADARAVIAATTPSRAMMLAGWLGLPAVALVLRLAYVATLPPAIVITFEADPMTYDQIARNILVGRGFAGASFYFPPGTEVPTSFWDPLYPYFLAAVYATVGHSIPAVRVVQAVVGATSVALLWHLGRRLATPAAGLVAASILACYPFLLYYTGQLLTETLFIGLILATVAAGIEAMRGGRLAWFAALGVVGGLAAMGRAEAFAFTLAYVPWCAFRAPRVGRRQFVVGLAAGWLALAATMAPWTIRNAIEFGRPIVTTTKLGYNLYKYYHPEMTPDQTTRVVPFPDLTGLDEPARADLMQSLGVRFMLENPARTAWYMAAKFLLLFKLTPSNDATRGYALVSLLSFGTLLPFMAAGLVFAIREGRAWWPVVGYVAFSVASKTAVFAGIRLRMQIEPFLVLFAAVAIVALARAAVSRLPVPRGARGGSFPLPPQRGRD